MQSASPSRYKPHRSTTILVEAEQREKKNARNRRSYRKHRLKVIKRTASYRKANRAESNRRAREYASKRRLILFAQDPKRAWLAQALRLIKSRAKKLGLACNLGERLLIAAPDRCPVLGIKLTYQAGKGRSMGSPSIDRINPSLGHIDGNLRVISHRANTLKSNATLAEMRLVLQDLERLND